MAYRRSHKKSRAGCLECKRRHIKCDEGRPVCRLCTMAEREMFCSYGPLPSSAAKAPLPAKGNAQANVPALMTSSEETTPSSTNSDVNVGGLEPPRHNLLSIPQQPSPSSISPTTSSMPATLNHAPYQTPFPTPVPVSSLPGEAVNMEHIELVVHMMRTKGMFNLGVNIGNYYKQMAIGFEYGLKDPYLTHQFLAYAARHLAYLHPDRYLYYTHQADTHQARAIQLFNLAISTPSSSSSSPAPQNESHSPNPINQSNCVAIVLFSSVLGQTLIAETFDTKLHPTFTHPNGSLDEFLKSYTQCLNTFRGVYHIGASAWPLLLNTPLAGYLLYSREFNQQIPRGHQCDLLVELLNMTYKLGKMSHIEHQVCLQMARYLQVGLDAVLGGADGSSTTTASATFSSSERDATHASSVHIPIPIDPRLAPNPSPPSPAIPIPAPQPPNCHHHPNPNHNHNHNPKPIHHAPDGTSKPAPAMSIAIAEPPQEISLSLSLSDLESDPTDPEMTSLNKSLNKYQMLSAFSMLCPAEFSSMLEQKRPEALVVLGYYALLLHYGRHMWQVGDAGRVILGMVDGYLGQEWRGWLRGPVGVVFGEGYGHSYSH